MNVSRKISMETVKRNYSVNDVWNEGYFTDVGYTYGYYRDISPVFQKFCLLIRGFAVAEQGDAAHCELGFGQGVSVNIHAASNPGQYVATDFNPEHAAHARTMAVASGSGARLYDDSFEQFLNRDDLPQFDSISLHGIWTWVSQENQKVITEFAKRYLKPGGLFYISYNCFPGWAPAHPLRQLFSIYNRFVAAPCNTVGRVDSALKFSETLLAAKPAYIKSAPELDARLSRIMKQQREYLAHEYFNREWNCMYFTDVVDALAPAKLDFATTSVPFDIVDAVNLPREGIDFLNTISHPIMREQIRDYFVNQQFRRDLFMRGALRLSPVEQRERLLALRFVLIQAQDKVPMKVQGALGEADLHPDPYLPILEALAARHHAPKSLRELIKVIPPENAYLKALQAIIILVGMGAVLPCQPENQVKQVKKSSDALNSYLCERAQFSPDILVLASPLTGTGVNVDRISQLFLLAQARKNNNGSEFVWQVLQANGEVLKKDNQPIQGADLNLAELHERYTSFTQERMPILKALGIA